MSEQRGGCRQLVCRASLPCSSRFQPTGCFLYFLKGFPGNLPGFGDGISVWDKILSVLPSQLGRGGRRSVTPPPSPAVQAALILPNQKDGVFSRNPAASCNWEFPISSCLLEAGRRLALGTVPRQVPPARQAKPPCLLDEIPPAFLTPTLWAGVPRSFYSPLHH